MYKAVRPQSMWRDHVFDLAASFSDVWGTLTTEHLLSSWEDSNFKTSGDPNADATEESLNEATKPRKLSSYMTPSSDFEEVAPFSFHVHPEEANSRELASLTSSARKASENSDQECC
jgi:hypothetical protein